MDLVAELDATRPSPASFRLPQNLTSVGLGKRAYDLINSPETSKSILVTSASPITVSSYRICSPSRAQHTHQETSVLKGNDSKCEMRKKHWETVLAEPVIVMKSLPRLPASVQLQSSTGESGNSSILASINANTSIVGNGNEMKEHKTKVIRRGAKHQGEDCLQRQELGLPSTVLENIIGDRTHTSRLYITLHQKPDIELAGRRSQGEAPISETQGLASAPSARKSKRFQCQYCSSTFAQRGDMVRHIRVKELGERNFRCNVCSKAFGRRSILNKHLDRVHSARRVDADGGSLQYSSDAAHALMSLSHR